MEKEYEFEVTYNNGKTNIKQKIFSEGVSILQAKNKFKSLFPNYKIIFQQVHARRAACSPPNILHKLRFPHTTTSFFFAQKDWLRLVLTTILSSLIVSYH